MEEMEQRLRELGFIGADESVDYMKDYSRNCGWKRSDSDRYHGWGGQVVWWLVEVGLSDARKRTYIMKCPYDTFGSAIECFVDDRVDKSRRLREHGVSVPRIEKYDKGTMVHEYVEGIEYGEAVKRFPGKKALYESKRTFIVSKIGELGYSLYAESNDGNYIVTPDDDVVLIDLDLQPTTN